MTGTSRLTRLALTLLLTLLSSPALATSGATAVGACCSSATACLDVQTRTVCDGAGGRYLGDGSFCTPYACIERICVSPFQPVDVSAPDAVVGDGTPGSCTEQALETALAGGGIVVFDCGSDEVVVPIRSAKAILVDTVLDGGGTVTLDGGGSSRILTIPSSFPLDTPHLTVQRLVFQNGLSAGPSTGVEGGGGAIYRRGGSLTIIDCAFLDNQAPLVGQDVAGGAVYQWGGGATEVSGSLFTGNRASNGGALGHLANHLRVYNTVIEGNAATGNGGNPGDGGNGGAIYVDGADREVRLCGVRIESNDANALGGGIMRVAYQGLATQVIDRSTIDGNRIPDQQPSMAGGMYLQGMAITITGSTISNNQARHTGGLFVGPDATLSMTNTTIASNTALSSLGGGLVFDDTASGTLLNCTIANNRAPGPVAFAAATVGGGGAVVMRNTLVDGHEVGNGWNPISCLHTFLEGGGNLQFPVERAGGGSDDPDALCSPGIRVADSRLGPLEDNGGPTATLWPAADSPAIGSGTGCPATDQRGEPRPEPCTSGAVEARPVGCLDPAAIGDFDGDARMDIVWRNGVSGGNVLWLMEGTTVVESLWIRSVDPSWELAGSGDFDGDGNEDLLWRQPASGRNAVWFLDGTAYRSSTYITSVGGEWGIGATGDMDCDGWEDIVWRNTVTGQNAVWLMEGASIARSAYLPSVSDPSWRIAGSGDFDGDGGVDILWRHGVTGKNAVWFLDGTTLVGSAYLAPVGDTGWVVGGTGDVDADGQLDILWRHRTTGQNAVWLMDGLSIRSGAYLLTVPSLDWRMAGPR